MNKVKSFFDDFVFHARVMPVLTAMFPVLLWGIYKGCIYKKILEVSIYLFLSLIFLTFASKVAREFGKKYEKKMYKELGGMPTTIVLRFSDNTIDNVTKARYHKALNEKLSDVSLPLSRQEENSESDDMYISAMNFLRNYANDNREKYPRVYHELKEYNYWRNLYGSKIFAIAVYVVIAVREVVLHKSFSVKELFEKPYPEYIAFIFMILGIGVICLFVNKDTVKRKAYDYAKTLAEVCETIWNS